METGEEEVKQAPPSPAEILKIQWPSLEPAVRRQRFFELPRTDAEDLFLTLSPADLVELLDGLQPNEQRSWIRLLALDDTADYIQRLPREKRTTALALLDEQTRREVMGLLAYAEDNAGGLMNPRYIRVRPNMTAEEAIRYLRAQARTPVEIIYYAYVLDDDQRLEGVVSFRDLILAQPEKRVHELMQTDVITVPEDMDREEVSRLFTEQDLLAIPVVDANRRVRGIVTHDDIVDVVEKEATEDIQKLGGVEAFDAPYLRTSFRRMIRKRAGWLTVLFVGEMLTATAMGHFQHEIERAVILALFIPLIISSGGNSGSQASTLIIRSLALREIRLRDWFRVLGREIAAGLTLGAILGAIGFARIILWQRWDPVYGDHYVLLAMTVAISLTGVVLWGSLAGSMLPFVLRKLGFDPATASAPFVATLVDVTGLVIYFSVASLILGGTLL